MKLIHWKRQARPSVFLIWSIILKIIPCCTFFSNSCLWADPRLRSVGITPQNACQITLSKVMTTVCLSWVFLKINREGRSRLIFLWVSSVFHFISLYFAPPESKSVSLPCILLSSSFFSLLRYWPAWPEDENGQAFGFLVGFGGGLFVWFKDYLFFMNAFLLEWMECY